MHPPRTSIFTSAHAFTLAEVMMATVVVLVAVVGLIQAVTIGSEMLDISRKQTTAMQIIRNEIDNVHLQSWSVASGLNNGATLYINTAGTGLTGSTTNGSKQSFALTNYTTTTSDDNTKLMGIAKGFTCTLAVSTVKTNLLKLTYTVSWTAGNRGRTYTRSGTTYYAKTGLNLYYQR